MRRNVFDPDHGGNDRLERPDADAVLTRVSDIESKDVLWVWPGRIPRGMLTMFEGDPGTGKSTLLLDLIARATCGSKMPDGTGGGTPATAVLLSAEDDPGATIKP